MKDNTRILVTGANGFLASSFVEYVNKEYGYEVDTIIRENSVLKDSLKDYISNIYYWDGNKIDFPKDYFADYIFHFS